MDDHAEKLDRVLLLLLAGMVFFTGALFAAKIWFKDDAALFTVLSGLVTGFAGSFFTRLKPKDTPPSLPISDKSSLDVSATLHQEAPKTEATPKDSPT
jgi:uncharacterized membrane protein